MVDRFGGMMARQQCLAVGCGETFPVAAGGGRPRKYCSDACRSRQRRWNQRFQRSRAAPYEQWEGTTEARHDMESAAYRVASAARRLAAELVAETEAVPDPARWPPLPRQRWEAPAGYTLAALDVLAAAQLLVSAAVHADRAANRTWGEIGQAFGVSADTAARTYRGGAGS